jgi:predicted PP-loop superfamily ATPase
MLSIKDVSDYRTLLETIIKEKLIGKNKIGIALSSGIDSSGLMFALVDMGYKVTAFSFHREGVISTDYKLSKQNCDALGIEFVEVVIPNKVDVDRLIHIMKDHSLKNKAAVECTYTMDFVWSKMQEYKVDVAFSGVGHDNHFGTTKKASIHYSSTLALCQEFRQMSFDHFDFVNTGKWGIGKQPQVWIDLALEKGIHLAAPAYDKRIYDFFYNFQFKELNTPKQKYPCWEAYDSYVKKTKLGKHTDLQCGDSQIRELFEPLLLDKNLNPNNKTSMLSFWRDWQDRLTNEEPEVKVKDRYKNIIIE